MRRISVLLIIFFSSLVALAQEQKTLQAQADILYDKYEYARAASMYKRIADKKKDKTTTAVLVKLADCYRQTNNYTAAAEWYPKLLAHSDAPPESRLFYADALKSLGRYEEAKTAYGQYAQSNPQAVLVNERIAGCDSAVLWMQHPVDASISNVQRLNSSHSDWGATRVPGGVVFMSDTLMKNKLKPGSKFNRNDYGRTNRPYYTLYVADTGSYGNVFIDDYSPSFNDTRYHVGPIAFDKSFNNSFVTFTFPDKKMPAQKSDTRPRIKYGYRRLELFTSQRDANGNWSEPKPFQYNKPDQYSLGHAALSNDESVLYFASDMPGGAGGTDIWYCERLSGGSWGTPVNCGPAINTADDEEFPTVAPDGTLYFSSKGHTGMGGFDMFSSGGSKAQWSTPQNLRYPFNSSADDFYYMNYGDSGGYFASNRTGGFGSDDIYAAYEMEIIHRYVPPGLTIPFTGKVCPPLTGACIYIYNRQRDMGWCFNGDPNREIHLTLEKETDYVIRIVENGVRVDSIEFNTRGMQDGETIEKIICRDKPLKAGTKFVLENFNYDFDKWDIRPDAALVLDSLANILRAHPTMHVRLVSYTDSRGSSAYNLQLSKKRAASAVEYLINHGISRQRISSAGRGDTNLLNHCKKGVSCTDAEHEVNRRTEVEILKE
ncbi:WD40-like Beta Propeller Repeat [Chitinophaga jiangningensis]|uniref:WD40-like Beta Propeller Repeat n=1 Tax=Chitinophaga jiangningensis TaxID=1419482 RepID=A0A1M6Z1F5_9BACT|nr:OmpA family protein [Chitinophaga jiangningensis]SHL24316.1 WD40-like Beta Propeller Repeat [Chitinophaga jiangningensis]